MPASETFWPHLVKDFKYYSVRRYKTENTIFFQGEIPPIAFIILKGYVVSYTIKNNGDEQIIAFFSSGDIIPVEWLFNKSPVSLYYYKAFTDCELIAVQKDEFIDQIEKDHQLTNMLLSQFANSFIGATVHIHALEHSQSRDKIIKVMHYLVLRFGKLDKANGTYTIPFKLTHAQIASLIGNTRESVTIETLKLKKLGALNVKKGIYTVNLGVLIKSIGSEEFDSLKISTRL
jgi:CRP-like cAMP-binding protein